MRRWIWAAGVAFAVFVWLWGNSPQMHAAITDVDDPVGAFSLTERSGRTVTNEDLRGKVWIASFIFTRCAGECMQISGTMARLQKELAGQKDVVLVSFTVDPKHDTPAVLRAYADRYHADPDRWLFLTGPKDPLYELIVSKFHLGVQEALGEDRKPGYEVTHSSKLVVVDQRGQIRGYFDGLQVDDDGNPVNEVPLLLDQVQTLVGKPSPLPALNAFLNGTSALLLVVGYAAIKRRRIAFHKACMLAALGVSAAFLVSYLYYHFAVLGGQPTRFLGQGWVRPVYFAVLLSHTVLAVVAAPLALYTASLGLRGVWKRHTRVARWTLPIWLYVSVTGVVVYLMLYQLYPNGGAAIK